MKVGKKSHVVHSIFTCKTTHTNMNARERGVYGEGKDPVRS